MTEWWVVEDGREIGPISTERLMRLARTQGVEGALVWREGMSDWRPLAELTELRLHDPVMPPPLPPPTAGVG